MGKLRTDASKRVNKAVRGGDGETEQEKRTSPFEEGQLPVDHPSAVSGGSKGLTFAFTY